MSFDEDWTQPGHLVEHLNQVCLTMDTNLNLGISAPEHSLSRGPTQGGSVLPLVSTRTHVPSGPSSLLVDDRDPESLRSLESRAGVPGLVVGVGAGCL
jgi:hypothetical protein